MFDRYNIRVFLANNMVNHGTKQHFGQARRISRGYYSALFRITPPDQ